jgi:CheY-like chemotaxis protein
MPRRTPDGYIEWSGYWADVTDVYEQAEELTRAKVEAEAGAAAKSTFLAMMSHEIRTPMAGVLSLVELLADTRLDVEQRNMLSMIQSSTGGLLQILDDVLDYSSIEADRLSLKPTPFDVRRTVDSVAGLFAVKAWDKALRVNVVVDWRIARVLQGDENRIRQILMNVVSNAIKFTERGHVSIRVDLVDHVGFSQTVRFTVEDSGSGIPQEKLANIFDPFVQVDVSATRRHGGTGLGLTISRRLAELMRGKLTIRSWPDRGTEAALEVALPVLEPTASDWVEAEFGGRKALLCVSDHKIGEAASAALSALGFLVMAVDPGGFKEMSTEDGVLVVYEEGCIDERGVPEHKQRIKLTLQPGVAVSPPSPNLAVVSCNPLLWRSMRNACVAVLGDDDDASSASIEGGETRSHVRVLVAEDNPIARSVIARQLNRLGVEHMTVENGIHALAELEKASYDVLITDCFMPGLDGFELAQRVRAGETSGGKRMKIFALTASPMPEEVARSLETGIDQLIAKPIGLEELRGILW